MSPSIPVNSPFMSLSFSRYVPFFHCQSFPNVCLCVLWFPCPLFALQSPLTPPVFIYFPFMSLSVPLHVLFSSRSFPFLLSCHVNFPSPACPCISLFFLPSFPCNSLHFPFAPRYFSPKTRFSNVLAKRTSNTVFAYFRQKEADNPNQQRAGRGIRAWDPCFETPAPRTSNGSM